MTEISWSTGYQRFATVLAVILITASMGSMVAAGSSGPLGPAAGSGDVEASAERTGPSMAETFLAQAGQTGTDVGPVETEDLELAVDHLADAVDPSTDWGQEDELRELPPLDPEVETALASIVEATARSIDARQQAAQEGPSDEAASASLLLGSSAELLATIDAALPVLQAADAGSAVDAPIVRETQEEPDHNVSNLLAIDLEGDTVYEDRYVLKIDLDGDDEHRDRAGAATGGCFVPCPETRLSIDVTGHDTYADNLTLGQSVPSAAQGAARGYFAVGMLVDATGDDRYLIEGELSGDDQAVFSRLTQGAAGAYGVGILADLGGDDVYRTEYTEVPDLTNLPDCGGTPCGFWIGTQGAVFQERGTVDPGWAMLLDDSGDDTYVAEVGLFPSQGDIDNVATTFDTVLEPGAAAFLDLGGNDHYEGARAESLNHMQRHDVVELASAHFLDTDAEGPSAQILAPDDGATLAGEEEITVRARDLTDHEALLAREVQQVTVSIGSIEATIDDYASGPDEQTVNVNVSSLEEGSYLLETEARNNHGATASDAITVTVVHE